MMQKKLKVLVLEGGPSAEREISLISSEAVKKILTELGHAVTSYDPIKPNATEIKNHIIQENPDVIFNALHGRFGEDGDIQKILDEIKIPYTHSGEATSRLAMDKEKTQELFLKNNMPIAKNYCLDEEAIQKNPPLELPLPLVIKPVYEGSSVGLYIIKDKNHIPDFSSWHHGKAMIEEYIAGLELTTSVIDMDGKATALSVTELQPKSGVYDYKAKYTADQTTHICPAQIDADIFATCKNLALKAHYLIGAIGVSRTDFRYDPKQKKLAILEINTQPGMTALSLVPEQARAMGISDHELIAHLLSSAFLPKPQPAQT